MVGSVAIRRVDLSVELENEVIPPAMALTNKLRPFRELLSEFKILSFFRNSIQS